MPGNARSGRRVKSADPVRRGRPVKPKKLGTAETYFWDQVIATSEHLETVDTPICIACCRAWRLYVDSVDIAQDDPTDQRAKSAVSSYGALLDKFCGRLAVDPLGRARQKPKRPDGVSPLTEFGLG